MRERGMSPIQVIYLLAVPTNVLTVGAGVMYGLNDAFVAALLMVAVIFRHRRYVLTAGVLVGLAALTKYYPLLLLPFFALDGRRLRWSVIVGGIAVFCMEFWIKRGVVLNSFEPCSIKQHEGSFRRTR